MKLKRILSLFLSCLLIVSSMGTVAFADASVAKVGNTEYATIDEAIVYHEDECLGAYEIKSENGSKYVEASSGDFSAFTVDANVAEVDTLSELQAALLDDETNEIIITEMIVIPEGETVTIDLNGHNISAVVNNNGKHIYALTNKGTLTIKDSGTDGKIVSRGIYNYGKLTLESGAIEACDVEGGYAVNNETGATFIMNGGAVATTNDDDPTTFETTDATAVDVPTGCSVTLNGGEISCISNWCYAVLVSGGNLEVPENSTVSVSGVHGAVSTGSGTTTISGGEFVCVGAGGVSSDHVLYTNGGKLTVNGGTFTNYNTDAGSNGAAVCAEGDAATVEINNGTFVGCEAAVYGNSNTVVNGGSYSLQWDDTYNTEDNLAQYVAVGATVTVDGEKKTKTESGLEVAPAHVAKIGDTPYATLQAAIDAVKDGETIVVLGDVTIEAAAYGQNALNFAKAVNCTIDLNGKTVSANTGNSVFRFNISGSGATDDVTVTLKNGKVISGSDTWCAVMAAGISADVKMILNLEDLTVENSKGGDLAVKAWENGVINAENVTINASYGGGFYAVGGEITLDNCTVNQVGLYTAPYLSYAFGVSGGGKMTINSGSYSAVPAAVADGNNQGTTHGSGVGGVMSSGGTLIINGGTFKNDNFGDDSLATAARKLIYADALSNVQINGGTFEAIGGIIDATNNSGDASKNGKVTLKGGIYSAHPVDSSVSYGLISVADGYTVNEAADGKFEVVESKYAAKIGDVKYETLAAALEAAKQAGITDLVITLIGETTADTKDSFDLVYGTAFDNVTIKQEDSSKVYYIYDIYTGSRTNGGAFIFDGVNIVVTDQYMFEGNVKLTNNSVIKSVAEANCFHYYCTTIVEPGSKLQGVIDELRGGTLIIDGGRNDGGYNTEADMQDSIMGISWSGDSLTVKNGAYLKVNAANEIGRITVGAETSLNVDASKVDAVEYITVIGAVNTDVNSLITTPKITGSGVISIDATGFDGKDDVQVITADMSGFTGSVKITGNDNATYEITSTGIVVSAKKKLDTLTPYMRNLLKKNTAGEDRYQIILFAGLDSLDYTQVGYEIIVDGQKITTESETVYTSFGHSGGSLTPDQLGENCKYIIGIRVNFTTGANDSQGNPTKDFKDSTVTFRPYAIDMQGDTIWGPSTTFEGIYNK